MLCPSVTRPDTYGLGYVVVGNSSQQLPDGNWRWTLYVRPSFDANLLEKVILRLHPTFVPDVVELTAPLFEFTAIGWGTFGIRVSCFVRGEEVMFGEHQLSFGMCSETTIPVTRPLPERMLNGKAAAGRQMAAFAREEKLKFDGTYTQEVVQPSQQDRCCCQDCYYKGICQAVLAGTCYECNKTGLMYFQKLCRDCAMKLGRCVCSKILQTSA
jgi:transcription initiation factor IIF auxiliary subunit